MIKPILAALMICSCVATKQSLPTNTDSEKQWKQEYVDGKITWSEYKSKLKSEKQP